MWVANGTSVCCDTAGYAAHEEARGAHRARLGPMTNRRLRVLPMRPRDVDEEHRVSTPLELLFDLSFVVAVSQAADQLNHALGVGHFHTAIVGFLMV